MTAIDAENRGTGIWPRIRRIRTPWITAVALVTGAVWGASLPGVAGAQTSDAVRTAPAARDSSGWLGVGLKVEPCGSGESGCARPVVGSVVLGSPAHEAGVRIGDTILSVGEVPVRDGARDPVFRTLRPGSPVEIVVRRSGRRVRLSVIPRVRPDSLAVVRFLPSDRGLPSRRAYVFAVPEARLGLESRSLPVAPGVPSPEEARPRVLRVVPTMREEELSRELVAARVEALRETLEWARARASSLNQEATSLDRLMEGRMAERLEVHRDALESWVGSLEVETEAAELAARQWRSWIDDSLQSRLVELHDSVLVVARSQMDSLARQRAAGLAGAPGVSGQSGVFIHRGGRDRVAGAEFEPMSPELAEFFAGVGEEGLLVLRVLPETPAARLGLRPGDVVVEVAGRVVRTVAGLRTALSDDRAGPVEVKWMRKGNLLSGSIRD